MKKRLKKSEAKRAKTRGSPISKKRNVFLQEDKGKTKTVFTEYQIDEDREFKVKEEDNNSQK